jgi:TetR/AcrR family transcriptional regulator, transcriptional repressor of bet genes
MPRPSNTEKRRAQITEALMKVMARHGYGGASVADIAAAAHLTPGLIHYHFKNKQEILLCALHALVARHDENLEEQLGKAGGDPIAEIEAFIDFHLGLGAEANPEALACWVLLGGEALREPTVRVELEKAQNVIAARVGETVRRGVHQKSFTCDAADADASASALVAVVQGYFVLAATARTVIPKGSAARSSRRMAEGLLRPVRPFTSRREHP